MTRFLTFCLAFAGCLAVVAAQSPDPKPVLAAISSARAEGQAKQTPPEELNAQIAEIAKKAVEGVFVDQISGDHTRDWASIFSQAGRLEEAAELLNKAYLQSASQAMNDQLQLIHLYGRLGQHDKILELIQYIISPHGASWVGHLSMTVYGAFQQKVETDPELVIRALDLVLANLNMKDPVSAADKKWMPIAYASISAQKYEVMYISGKEAEAIEGLKKLRAEVLPYTEAKDAFGNPPTHSIDTLLKKYEMTDNSAPKVVYDRVIGEFKGLDSLRGRVVMLDFFAHWCGPCIASFPTLRKLLADYGDQGFSIVGLTGYYGYYGAEEGISEEAEYQKMLGFKEQRQMEWPIAFDKTRANTIAYGVSGIPHMVIIDRKGNIRRIEVGFSPQKEAALRKLLEELLAEPA